MEPKSPQPPAPRAPMILVSGGAHATAAESELAESVGRLLAEAGAVVLTGGGAGVMEAASRGARSAGGIVLAVLPGADATVSPPNPHAAIALFTGMGDARNAVLVASADAVIAIGGGWGTLSEIALARKAGRPVVLLESWGLAAPAGSMAREPRTASTPEEAVGTALASARRA